MRELVDDEIFPLLDLALDSGIASLADGGILIPFALVEDPDGNRRLARFVVEPYEEAVAAARAMVASETAVVRALIAYDGYVTLDGERTDALLIDAQDRRRTHSVAFALRYRPASAPGGFELLGDPTFVGPGEPLL